LQVFILMPIFFMDDGNKLIIGGVYKLKGANKPCRVISFNKIQVFYDEWWPHINSWGMTNLKIKHYYTRTSFKFFSEVCEFLKTEPLTDSEFKIHRPDLEMWFIRSEILCWTKCQYLSLIECKEYLRTTLYHFLTKRF